MDPRAAPPARARNHHDVTFTDRATALLALALAAGGCAAPRSPAAATAKAWGDGPAHWLLLPEDRERLARVETNTDFSSFLARFWSCRDSDPQEPDNPFGRLFAERVIAADRLYEEPELRGSLTARGGALLLLGPPRFLRYSERRAPSLEGTTASGARPTRLLRVEIWGYLPRDLPDPLRELVHADEASEQEIALTFLVSGRHARLLEGGDLLELAARAASHCPSEP
jgi:GWxTD domain-containing protein